MATLSELENKKRKDKLKADYLERHGAITERTYLRRKRSRTDKDNEVFNPGADLYHRGDWQ